jgi:hypothetical protein
LAYGQTDPSLELDLRTLILAEIINKRPIQGVFNHSEKKVALKKSNFGLYNQFCTADYGQQNGEGYNSIQEKI